MGKSSSKVAQSLRPPQFLSRPFNTIIPILKLADDDESSQHTFDNLTMVLVSFWSLSWHIYMVPKGDGKMHITEFIEMIRKERGWTNDIIITLALGCEKMQLSKNDPLDLDEYVREYLDEFSISEMSDCVTCKAWNRCDQNGKLIFGRHRLKDLPRVDMREVEMKEGSSEPTCLELTYVKKFNTWLLKNGYEFMDPNLIIPILRQYEDYKMRGSNRFNQLIGSIASISDKALEIDNYNPITFRKNNGNNDNGRNFVHVNLDMAAYDGLTSFLN